MRTLLISEHFHGEPRTEVAGVYQRMHMLIDAAKELGELDLFFYVRGGINTSPGSVLRWEEVLSAYWGADFSLFLCQKLGACQQEMQPLRWVGLFTRLLARGAFNITSDKFGVGTSGDAQVRALESCLDRQPDVIIACDAGVGQFTGEAMPMNWAARMGQSFEATSRKVQDATKSRLHSYLQTGELEAFVYANLGQIDSSIPVRPTPWIDRAEVVKYPTDFSGMDERDITRLSARGEQITRTLISQYLWR